MEEKEFLKYILNDEYIKWLDNFVDYYKEFDTCYFYHYGRPYFSEKDDIFVRYLSCLFDELNKYGFKNEITFKNTFCYLLKHNEKLYEIFDNGDCYCCRIGNNDNEIPIIDYDQLKKTLKKKK